MGGSSSEKGGLWKEKRGKGRGGGFWPLLCTFTYYKYIISIMTNTLTRLRCPMCTMTLLPRGSLNFPPGKGNLKLWKGNIDRAIFSRGSGGIPKCAKPGALQ